MPRSTATQCCLIRPSLIVFMTSPLWMALSRQATGRPARNGSSKSSLWPRPRRKPMPTDNEEERPQGSGSREKDYTDDSLTGLAQAVAELSATTSRLETYARQIV